MSRTTKLELQQLLTIANAEREALRVKVAELEGTIEALRSKQQRVAARPAWTPPAPSAEQLAFRARCAAAKAEAMSTGRSVRL